ncbi:MAG: hypothetical protein GC200_07630 [Tepidisphaera sp.]|nr:hypothetical protein [Tepidisphaera sp.]
MKTVIRAMSLVSVLASAAGLAHASSVYNSIDSTLLDSYPSLGYQATSTAEFGDRVTLGGTARQLTSATVTMVDWARYEDYNVGGQYYDNGQWAGSGFYHNLTLNIYDGGTGNAPGALIASVTQNSFIAYRPTGWSRNGYAQNVTFDLSTLNVNLPESIVWSIAFNTQTHGYNPIGAAGPYNSLNLGLNDAPGGGITVGSTDLDKTFWNTSYGPFYADGGASGVGTFREDTTWTGYNPMIDIQAVPAPGAAAALGLAGLVGLRRRR